MIKLNDMISKTFSNKNHLSLLSIDFEKAFDQIGPHVILNRLAEWKIGPRLISYVKSFLHTYLAQTPEIGQGLGRFLSCGARKQEQT